MRTDKIEAEAIALCDRYFRHPNGQVDLLGVGGVSFIATLPRGLCYLYVRLRIPHLAEGKNYSIRAVVNYDEMEPPEEVFRTQAETFSNDRSANLLHFMEATPVSAIFDLDKKNEIKPFRKEGHYTVEVRCTADYGHSIETRTVATSSFNLHQPPSTITSIGPSSSTATLEHPE